MAILFSSREFIDEFKTRNVVFESCGSIARNGDLIFRTVVEFGDNGSIKRQSIINIGMMNTFNIATQVGEYQASILEIIDSLECFLVWLKGNKSETFSMFLDQAAPLYLHGKVVKDKVTFSAFGPDLINLELKCSNARKLEVTPFGERIAAIAEHYRSHLKQIDGINLNTVIQNALANMEKVA